MNKVTLIGRLTKKAEVRYTESNTPVASFTLAVSRIKKEEADFINCVAWNKLAEIIEKYTDKGKQIAIEGRIQTRNYEDENGKKVYITEVVVENLELLGSKTEETPESTLENQDLPF